MLMHSDTWTARNGGTIQTRDHTTAANRRAAPSAGPRDPPTPLVRMSAPTATANTFPPIPVRDHCSRLIHRTTAAPDRIESFRVIDPGSYGVSALDEIAHELDLGDVRSANHS